MTWEEAIEYVVNITKQDGSHYYNLCREENPSHKLHRERIIKKAEDLQRAEPVKNPVIMPSIRKQLINVGMSMAKFAVSGFKIVSEEVEKTRLDVCLSCDKLKDDRCIECGCYVKQKVKIAIEECPLRKWLKEEIKSYPQPCGVCGQK